jgi:tetratricopeptide (TPR) repeat protein
MSAREADAGPLGLTALYCARSMWLNSQGERDRGFEEAQKAVECAEGGPDTQRAAQRLVYTSLTQVKLQLGEEAAKRALAHSGSRPELKARSLRALGVVLMWQHKPAAAIEKFEAVVNLAQSQGLLARLPIAWHDLGDARRIGGALKDARAAYDKAIDSARELKLTSSVMLIQFKLFLCDIVEGKTEGLAERIAEATPQAMASGLSLAAPFANMMLAWFHAREGRLRVAQLAYSAVADMRINAIDPQFPVIMEEIGRAVVTSKEASTYRELATEALSLGREYWARYGQSERAEACESLLRQLPGDD